MALKELNAAGNFGSAHSASAQQQNALANQYGGLSAPIKVAYVNAGLSPSDVQTITISGTPTGGSFTVTCGGQTATIPYNATPAQAQSLLQALSTIGSGNMTVTGTAGQSYVCTFAGALANQPQALMTVSGAGLTGGTSPAATIAHTIVGASYPLLDTTDPAVVSLLQQLLAKVQIPTDAQYEAMAGGYFSAGSTNLSDAKTVAQMYALAAAANSWCAAQLPMNDI